jgi:outer membrane protein assembly factor BamB
MRERQGILRGTRAFVLVIAVSALAGCSEGPSMPRLADLNPFAEKEVPLPGKRVPIMTTTESLPGELAAGDRPVALPPPQVNASWSQPGGSPSNALGHLVVGASLKQTWTADAGTGSSKSAKLTASPIVYEGRVFTLDADSEVRAFSATGGGLAWKASMRPEGQRGNGGHGGGIAAENGRIYAASGFGTVAAIDAQSGKKLWEKPLGVALRASPTVAGGRLIVVAVDGRAFCLYVVLGSWLQRTNLVPVANSFLSTIEVAPR